MFKTTTLHTPFGQQDNYTCTIKNEDTEAEVCSLPFLARQLPWVLSEFQVSLLIDEWHIFKYEEAKTARSPNERKDVFCAKIFALKTTAGYPLLSRVIKVLLSLPHGNAVVERGFSKNLEGRSSHNIGSISGIR